MNFQKDFDNAADFLWFFPGDKIFFGSFDRRNNEAKQPLRWDRSNSHAPGHIPSQRCETEFFSSPLQNKESILLGFVVVYRIYRVLTREPVCGLIDAFEWFYIFQFLNLVRIQSSPPKRSGMSHFCLSLVDAQANWGKRPPLCMILEPTRWGWGLEPRLLWRALEQREYDGWLSFRKGSNTACFSWVDCFLCKMCWCNNSSRQKMWNFSCQGFGGTDLQMLLPQTALLELAIRLCLVLDLDGGRTNKWKWCALLFHFYAFASRICIISGAWECQQKCFSVWNACGRKLPTAQEVGQNRGTLGIIPKTLSPKRVPQFLIHSQCSQTEAWLPLTSIWTIPPSASRSLSEESMRRPAVQTKRKAGDLTNAGYPTPVFFNIFFVQFFPDSWKL